MPHYVDQLTSGREFEGMQKESLTPGYQKTNSEMITGAINSDTTNNAATTGATNMTINSDGPVTTVVNQSLTTQ